MNRKTKISTAHVPSLHFRELSLCVVGCPLLHVVSAMMAPATRETACRPPYAAAGRNYASELPPLATKGRAWRHHTTHCSPQPICCHSSRATIISHLCTCSASACFDSSSSSSSPVSAARVAAMSYRRRSSYTPLISDPSMSTAPTLATADPAKLESEAVVAWEKAYGEAWPSSGRTAVLKGVMEFNAVHLPVVEPYQAAVASFFNGLPSTQCLSPASCIAAASSYPAILASFKPTKETTILTHPLTIAECDTATGCVLIAWQDAAPTEPEQRNVRHWRLLYSQRMS
jgi:hypothetical protein